MSILIKGVGMPKQGECIDIVIFDDGTAVFYDDDKKIGEAVELPDHGDLIERDALMTRLGMAMDCEDCPNRTALYFCGLPRDVMEVCDELENTPVVIPEERSEDETD